MPITAYQYIQYGGIWTTDQAADARAQNKWPVPPPPEYRLYAWGINTVGQLGLGNTTSYSSPKQVGVLTNWLEISSGAYYSLGIKTDGTLWSWGVNNLGQLGLGNTTAYSSPKQVGSLTNWSTTESGSDGSNVAVKTDGTLWSWGFNNDGQLGLGDTTQRSSPTQVGLLTNWLKISNGYSFVIALKTDGTLWSWGRNNAGQLGIGDTTNRSSPVQVGSLTDWLTISAGFYSSSVAVKTDGTIWSWGRNTEGQLGLGNRTNYSSPKQIGSLTVWANTVCGRNHTLAFKTGGTLWSWGLNTSGQLGLGNRTNYSSPKQVGSLTDWLKGACGNYCNVIIKTNGTLWSWGVNTNGQLGLGNTTSYSSPKQVGSLTNWVTASCDANTSSLGITLN